MSESHSNAPDIRNVGFVSGGKSMPSGAVLLNPEQIFEMQQKLIETWLPSREMYSIKYGSMALGGMAAITGFIFISHFRTRMLLRNYGRLASFAPTVFFPGVVTTVLQQSFVTSKVLSGEIVCPVCAQMRSLSIQVLTGIAQPFFLAVLASSALAKTVSTYPIPPINDVRAMTKVFAKLCQPLRTTVIYVVFASMFSAFAVAHSQGRATERIHQKLTEKYVFVSR